MVKQRVPTIVMEEVADCRGTGQSAGAVGTVRSQLGVVSSSRARNLFSVSWQVYLHCWGGVVRCGYTRRGYRFGYRSTS